MNSAGTAINAGMPAAADSFTEETESEMETEPESFCEETESELQDGVFVYVHDPRENPEAMKDIIENEDAVYGFSPDPESPRLGPYAEYDWTDPELVAATQEERRAYHESMDSMTDILYRIHEDGPTPDDLYEKYGSWTTVLQKAFSPNLGMDACCGLYDEYYWLYIELGYAE
jgi:hypothetical protein